MHSPPSSPRRYLVSPISSLHAICFLILPLLATSPHVPHPLSHQIPQISLELLPHHTFYLPYSPPSSPPHHHHAVSLTLFLTSPSSPTISSMRHSSHPLFSSHYHTLPLPPSLITLPIPFLITLPLSLSFLPYHSPILFLLTPPLSLSLSLLPLSLFLTFFLITPPLPISLLPSSLFPSSFSSHHHSPSPSFLHHSSHPLSHHTVTLPLPP
ncbi:hypothetical protein Pcinc_033565 [Petrolisthes cinctipes]|uniref:Uncharacterized protein n=1 Tax=Petrolisthes cinctipes TaxID=88211 RepID=A0AAE1K1M0_PETCI|nr:hypothetical protein Pcinc_033565 [Petrolisthes cinctipes]